MKPTLLVLAAGMGSRYGGLKQLDTFGPNGYTLMDYSVFDAMRAGFGRVVFVIRRDFEQDFREKILAKYDGIIDTAVVFQESNRRKPWGAAHAVIAAKGTIKEPFLMINADDFYGLDTFKKASLFLTGRDTKNEYCIIGFELGKTLSDSGGVNRGVCELNQNGELIKITENKNIIRDGDNIKSDQSDNLDENTPVSMSAICFTPEFLEYSYKYFTEIFYPENKDSDTAELNISAMLDYVIQNKIGTARCVTSNADWFGVTYREDKPIVDNALAEKIAAGDYTEKLF